MEAVVLAAGKSTRMKSRINKVLHKICNRPVLFYVVEALKPYPVHIVVNPDIHEAVRELFPEAQIHIQNQQRGTGHALSCAIESIKDKGFVVVNGDTPLINRQDIEAAVALFEAEDLDCVVLTARMDNPSGYGRIVRNESGITIVEEKDANEQIRKINEINSGIYVFKTPFVREALKHLENNNAAGEFYLTDIVPMANRVKTLTVDAENVLGINTRNDLALVRKIIQKRIIERFDDVTFIDPDSTYVNYDVEIGQDTVIFPNVSLRGKTKIGKECIIDTGSVIEDSVLYDNVHVKPYSVIEQSTIHNNAEVGPFAHLRPYSELCENVRIGNFVEVKKSTIGKGTKASHLTYIGDAELGEDVNVGCGTITCNYDGYRKNKTIIGDRVFIGSDVQLVAPVKVEHDALIAAGTTVVKDVEPFALAISRVPQVNKPGWVKRFREKMEKKLGRKDK